MSAGRAFLALILVLITLLVPSDGYLGTARITFAIDQAVGNDGFHMVAWEAQALEQKAHDVFTRPGDDLSPVQQHDLVLAYLDTISTMNGLSADIQRIYADPAETNPRASAAPLQARLDSLRAEQAQRRPAVERILEWQVSAVLQEQGLITAGMLWPPLLFQFTDSPDVLIISPRERIEYQRGVLLTTEQSIANMEKIERQTEKQLDVSALVEGTGGLAAYPTMVIAVPDLGWVLDTIAHEWTHTYLAFHPLGQHYFDSGETRTLNETTASIVGNEVGQLVLERYYPDQVPTPPVPAAKTAATDNTAAKPAFDFGQTMRDTRLHVDALLAEGRMTEAENYMESQRQILVAHGYNIRKLNQAYFAFHGSYAVGPTATDPIGDKLRSLRQHSQNLAAFVKTVAAIRSVQELDAALAGLP